MNDSKHYSMAIQWDDEDKIYIVSIPEFQAAKPMGKHIRR